MVYKILRNALINQKGNHLRELAATNNSRSTDQKRLRIIKQAIKLFAKNGYRETSMRDISKATGIDLSNLYNFITGKEEILFLVFETLHEPAAALFDKYNIEGIKDPEEQLKVAVFRLAEIMYKHRHETLLLYRESKSLPKSYLQIVLEREKKLIGRLEGILKKGMKEKKFRQEDAFFRANLILFQLALYPIRGWNLKKYSKEAILEMSTQSVMKSISLSATQK